MCLLSNNQIFKREATLTDCFVCLIVRPYVFPFVCRMSVRYDSKFAVAHRSSERLFLQNMMCVFYNIARYIYVIYVCLYNISKEDYFLCFKSVIKRWI